MMKLREKDRWDDVEWTEAGQAVLMLIGLVVFIGIINVSAIYKSDFCRGIPTTYEGEIVYISYYHNKWQNYNWTHVEIQITLEKTAIVYLWKHPELETGIKYEIETIRHIERGQRFPWMMLAYDEVVEVRLAK